MPESLTVRFLQTFSDQVTVMDTPNYTWYASYREAILETDRPKMRAQLLFAEKEMVQRLRVLSQDHGGTAEERQALADALNGIKNLRAEISELRRVSGTDIT